MVEGLVFDLLTKVISNCNDRIERMYKLDLMKSKEAFGKTRVNNIKVRGPRLSNLLADMRTTVDLRKELTVSSKVYRTHQVRQERVLQLVTALWTNRFSEEVKIRMTCCVAGTRFKDVYPTTDWVQDTLISLRMIAGLVIR